MANRVISIELGYSLTKICEVDYRAKNPKVYHSFVIETPQGVLDDGAVELQEDFTALCRNSLAERKIKAKQVIFSVASSKIATREVMIPQVKENRIIEIVKANAMEYFPIDVSQYQFAYNMLKAEEDAKGNKQYRILVLAVPNRLILSYTEFAKALGLSVAALDYNGNSVYQAVKEEFKEGTQMMIKIDERATLVTVIRDSAITLTRTVAYGIDDALHLMQQDEGAEEFDSVTTYLQAVALAQRETCILPWLPVKEEKEESRGITGETAEEDTGIQLRGKITETFSYLIGGISRVIDYYNTRNAEYPIEEMYITGSGSSFKGLEELLSNEIGNQITVIQQSANLQVDKRAESFHYGTYMACVGAAIAPLDLISELTKSKKTQKGKKKTETGEHFTNLAILICVVGVSAAVILAVISIVPFLMSKNLNTQLSTRKLELKPAEEIYNAHALSKSKYDKLAYYHDMTKNYNEALVDFLTEMEAEIPANTAILSMDVTADTVRFEMTADTKEAVAKTVEMLRGFESVAYVEVDTVSKQALDTGEEKQTFAITVQYKAFTTEEAALEEQTEAQTVEE